MRSLATIVHDALERGSLIGTEGYGRTLTLAGKRRITIRLQSDIFRALHTPDTGPPYYPDLWADILVQVVTERGESSVSVDRATTKAGALPCR